MAFDYSKLSGRITEKFGSQRAFAEAFGVSEQVFSQKMNNKVRFSTDDMVKIADMLEFPAEEISAYFFRPKVSKS